MSLPNPGMDFTAFDTLPASSLDDMVENIEALADGSGLNDDAVTAAKMKYGMIRARRGGTTGDNSWGTGGTSNTDTSAKDAFEQVGAVVGAGSGVDVAVTFPVAFTVVPVVFTTPQTANAANVTVAVNTVTTTSCNIRQIGGTGVETIGWRAVGQ